MAIDITKFINLDRIIEKVQSLPIPGLSFLDTIGIDLGTTSIKIVQMKKIKDKFQLVRWSLIPLSAGTDKTDLTPEEKVANMIDVLKTYRGSGKGIPKNAVCSISGNSVIVRYVKFQKLTHKELSKTIKAEAEPYIPFNIEEVFIGFHPLRDITEEGKLKMETVLVVAKQELVNSRVEVLESSGFKPVIMDVDAFALESVYESIGENPLVNETILIANIGASQTNFVIVENGLSMAVKDSTIAGNSISKSVMKNLGVDIKVAEKLKLTNGLLITAQEKEQALNEGKKEALGVSNALTTILKDIGTEIKKLIEFYMSQGPERQVNRILLAGGSANIKNLIPYFEKELNLPVNKMNPFANIIGSEGIPEEYQTTLAVACGLARRRAGDIKEK